MSMLSFVRETYTGFKSLIIGMRITAREATKPIITVQYPHDTLPMPTRFRGHIQLTLDAETGRPRCTACTLCAKACPSGCIDLDGIKREGDKKKSVSKYMLDFTKCSLCGSCVEVCPSDAIEFSKQYNAVSLHRETFDHIDLYRKIEREAGEWTKTHPAPVAASPTADSGRAATPLPTAQAGVPSAGIGRAGTPFPAVEATDTTGLGNAGAERSPRPTSSAVSSNTATPQSPAA